jgi:hypothetical protein
MKIRKILLNLRVVFLWKTIKREWDKIDAGGRGGKACSEGLESALSARIYGGEILK